MKKLALALLLAMPMVVSAAGMGVYVPFSVGDTAELTHDNDQVSFTYDQTLDFKSAAGIGFVFDSNIGKDKLFNYRIGLEYMPEEMDTSTINGYTSTCGGHDYCDMSRFNIVQTFGFGVLRTKMVRLWVGPRINIAWNWRSNDYDAGYYTATESEVAFEFGIAPAVGVNVNLGKLVSLGFDVDYRFAGVVGAWEDDGNTGTYSGNVKGATARFTLLFRFGEEFQKQAPQTANQGVVDQSL
ncbi:MAG: hypothetical protein KAH32_09010 [Chlamydiia bacterium]|nr:hypothetical protein [Chlamydiia bacterium]